MLVKIEIIWKDYFMLKTIKKLRDVQQQVFASNCKFQIKGFKQAGTVLGQAQLKLELELYFT